jgi:hypothetical protein
MAELNRPMQEMSGDNPLENELDRVFAAYRAACPEPEPSANFMPELWARIESRRSFRFQLTRWGQLFATGASVACFAVVLTWGAMDHAQVSYVEALLDDPAPDNIEYTEVRFTAPARGK